MGAGMSVKQEDLVVAHYMPSFLIRDPDNLVNPVIGDKCMKSLDKIMKGESVGFKAAKEKEPNLLPLPYFYNLFYGELFLRHPILKPYFLKTSMIKQGEMLVKTLCALANLSKLPKEESKAKIIELADRHNKRRIHPAFYTAFCTTLFDALRQTLKEDFTEEVEHAWLITFSYIMKIMMPAVVRGCKDFADPSTPPFVPTDAPSRS